MSVSGILSSSFLQNQLSGATSSNKKNMQQLGQDLQAGNLSAAQSDFAALEAAFTQSTSSSTTSTSAASSSDPVAQAFQQLASDLKAGDVTAAQKDFATAQQDLQSQGGSSSHNLHNHHRMKTGGADGSSTNQNSLLQDLSQVGQNLTSGNLTGAQQAYATLQQELQQATLGSGTQTNALVAQPLVSLQA